MRLGGDWVVAGGREMSVTTKVGVGVNFKAISPFRIQSYSLSPRGLQILYHMDYCISVGRYWILREAGALMRHVGDIRYGAPLR